MDRVSSSASSAGCNRSTRSLGITEVANNDHARPTCRCYTRGSTGVSCRATASSAGIRRAGNTIARGTRSAGTSAACSSCSSRAATACAAATATAICQA